MRLFTNPTKPLPTQLTLKAFILFRLLSLKDILAIGTQTGMILRAILDKPRNSDITKFVKLFFSHDASNIKHTDWFLTGWAFQQVC